MAFRVYYFLIIAWVLMSWLGNVRETPVGLAIGRLVEPYLALFRFIPPIGGMIDISPIVALFALRFVESGFFTVLGWIVGAF
nr:YggT family protein [Numidum massiliense]